MTSEEQSTTKRGRHPIGRRLCVALALGTVLAGSAHAQVGGLLIQAEDYDRFHDRGAGNYLGAYRSDDVDIEATADVGGGFNVGATRPGEWLEYDITLAAGVYEVTTRVASRRGGGAFSLSLDGTSAGSDVVDRTGGWQSWETHSLGQVTVGTGSHTLRIDTTGGGYNLNWIAFTPVATGEAVETVEAEDYDDYFDTSAGNNGGAYRADDVDIEAASDVGGGFNVGWTAAGEWLEYSVALAAGSYEVTTRVASLIGGAQYRVSLGGVVVGSDQVGATGGWQSWETHTIGFVTVDTPGTFTLRVDQLGGEYNLNRITLTPATAPLPPGPYQLVWQDEFNGTSIDTSKWSHEVNARGGGNNELQYYTARQENSWVSNGRLVIQALRENYTGPEGTRSYTSARLRTLNRGDWLYGRVEVRAKLPAGKGLWPAIWMLPTDWVYGGWAASGEIDIMEAVNLEAGGGNRIHGTLHYGGQWPNNTHTGNSMVPSTSVVDNFHEYAIEWEPGEIRWYIDGEHYQTQTSWWSSNGAYPAPFDRRFHLILNVAVGGNWPGSPNGSTVFPQTMEVDYVRVYEASEGGTGISDGDGDGVPDGADQCPGTPAGVSVDSVGCPIPVDGDGDGVPDEADQCPGTPAGVSVDSVGCPIPVDGDGDGVPDGADQCPGTPAGVSVDTVGCPISVDGDGDGVNDDIDQCPGTPAGVAVDGAGCPIPAASTLQVEAEDYDDYFDTDAGNDGGAYRSDDVDIQATTDVGGGFNVGWTAAGEWMEYSIALAAGSYQVTTRVASQVGGAQYRVSLDGVVVGSDQVGATGGWQSWQTHTIGNVTVDTSGEFTLRVETVGGYYNLNWIRLTPGDATPPPGTPVSGVRAIYETDMTLDVDDVGGLAVLHGLQNEGHATILAVTYNEVHPSAPEAIDAINTYYNRGNIPIGYYDKSLTAPDGDRYLNALSQMDHDPSDNTVDTALNVYKQVLAAQPDDSVVIISVGFLNNLYDLLQDPEGFALAQSKVTLLAVMGGRNNDGFNFVRHNLVSQTEYVLRNWPGSLVTTHVGVNMITGETLSSTTPDYNPVRRAFEIWTGGPNRGRASWDEVTVLYAVLGTQYYNEEWTGTGSLTNGYVWNLSYPDRGYAWPMNDGTVENEIERLMTLPPQ